MDPCSDSRRERSDARTHPPPKALTVYRNLSPRLIILRCIGSQHFFLEKVIFPWEDCCFLSPPFARVELWSYGMAGVELLDAMDAEELQQPCLQRRSNDKEAWRWAMLDPTNGWTSVESLPGWNRRTPPVTSEDGNWPCLS